MSDRDNPASVAVNATSGPIMEDQWDSSGARAIYRFGSSTQRVAMDGEANLVGARIEIGVSRDADTVNVAGRVETAESAADGIVRISGALTSGARFVLVTNDEHLASVI